MARQLMRQIGLRLALGLSGLTFALGACLIDERQYDKQLDECTNYCKLVDLKCTEPYTVYDRDGACMAVCMQMELGDELGGNDANTVRCRINRLEQGGFEASSHCAQIGPGGAGVCGSNCEGLCALRAQVCGSIPTQANDPDILNHDICMHNCAALPDLKSFNTARDRFGDSVQCRLVHVSESAISGTLAETHCPHTQTIPVPGETVPCSDDTITPEENCDKYCSLVMGACESGLAIYDNRQQCMSVCRLLEPGMRGDQNGDSVRCRRYHAYNALSDPNEHCTHAGPTGDGHCGGGNCPDYCRIARQACPDQFEKTYPNLGGNECETACGMLSGAGPDGFRDTLQRYNVTTPATGNNVQCRTYHAVEALAAPNDAAHCLAAFGLAGSECR